MNWRTDKARDRGRDAYVMGKHLPDNPYTHETSIQSANHKAWADGWLEAAAADPLLDDEERAAIISRRTKE